MKTVAIIIPRESYGEARAIVETVWEVTRQKTFMQALKEYASSIDELFSFEIYCHRQITTFYITAHSHTIDIINGSLYAIYPGIQIEEREDFTKVNPHHWNIATSEIKLREKDIIPFKDASYLQQDSLSALLTTLTRLPYEGKYILQFVCSPIQDSALLRAGLKKDALLSKLSHLHKPKFWVKEHGLTTRFEAIDKKSSDLLFGFSGRICAMLPEDGEYEHSPEDIIRLIIKGGYTECASSSLNKLLPQKAKTGPEALYYLQDREYHKPYRLTASELSTLWHLPDVDDGLNIESILSRKNNPPAAASGNTLSKDTTVFAENIYRERSTLFGLNRHDRSRHAYVVGQTGAGKSKLFELLAKTDIHQGQGLAVIDPHGDLVDDILKHVPEDRIDDVVLVDPTDTAYPVSFNPVAQVPELEQPKVCATLLESFKKVLGNVWSENLQRLLQKSLETILQIPGGTLETMLKILASSEYRRWTIAHLTNKDLIAYWENEFPSLREKQDDGVISPLLNFLGELLAPDPLHDMLCQPLNRLHFRKIMDSKRILLIKIPKGALGDTSAALLGSLFLARIYQAALTRSDIPAEERVPFHLYVDEFHTFTTTSLKEMLSESRKFGLCLTLSNQFLTQVDDETRATLLSNVGTIISMKVGGADASSLSDIFSERFSAADLINLSLRDFVIKMPVEGETCEAFSGRTLDCFTPAQHHADLCRAASRARYALPAESVNDMVRIWSEAA